MKTEEYQAHFYQVVQKVEEGLVNPLDAFIELRTIESALKDAIASVTDAACEERRSYGKEEIVRQGSIVELVEGSPRYSYKHIPQWTALKEKMKGIEQMSKMASSNLTGYVVDENGEEVEAAEVTYTKPYIKLRSA